MKRTEQGGEQPAAGHLLLEWLRLLGWRVHLCGGNGVSAVAEHVLEDGECLLVHARGGTVADVAGLLFERTMALIETGATRPGKQPAVQAA